jgi:hypothetical protein
MTRRHRHYRALVAAAVVGGWLLVGVSPALAQRPHGTPPGLTKTKHTNNGKPSSSSSSNGSQSSLRGDVPTTGGEPGGGASSRVRSLGVWLDDATVMSPGESWLTLSMQRWASPIASGFDGPIVDTVAGLGTSLHTFLSVPYTKITYDGAAAEGELGTIYAGAKIGLRDPSSSSLGLAVSPTVEVLSTSAAANTGYSRLNLVLPASLEWRKNATRIYGSTGYFTRGAFFLGGAWEQTLTDKWIVTGTLSQAWSTKGESIAEEFGLLRKRTDMSGGVSFIASPHLMLFGSFARTLSSLDADATRYAVSFGASMNLYKPGRRTPVKKP